MTTPRDAETAQLIEDLFAEAHGLRMRYEEFSRYTEEKIADFVAARKELERTSGRDLLEADLRVLREQREQLHAQLVAATSRAEEAGALAGRLTEERDEARARVAALEASRAVRVARLLRRLAPRRRRTR